MSRGNSRHTNSEATQHNTGRELLSLTTDELQDKNINTEWNYNTNQLSGTRVFLSLQHAGAHGGILIQQQSLRLLWGVRWRHDRRGSLSGRQTTCIFPCQKKSPVSIFRLQYLPLVRPQSCDDHRGGKSNIQCVFSHRLWSVEMQARRQVCRGCSRLTGETNPTRGGKVPMNDGFKATSQPPGPERRLPASRLISAAGPIAPERSADAPSSSTAAPTPTRPRR